MRNKLNRRLAKTALLLATLSLSACGSHAVQRLFNPFYQPPTEQALQGEMNDRAISGGARDERARAALEHAASYKRKHLPEPVNPVMQPAVVRLMWVPDRLNRSGDLIPAHYYYLRVLNERWAVNDAFELEAQLESNSTASNIPYISTDNRFGRQ